ncbi:hypothetical protein LOK49_LG08G01970 [Camellia lanceoleosa]|uniref:Uncharacterized protein n=1 Tax=Camellia lanceoleosa TaxID=1840588 RepID=A0ACC0GQ18_9ERIC|nr:hypothetical protein LOK49_LG08G01970 [Camellia lanceoleosa]
MLTERYSAVNPRGGEIEKICTYHPLLTFTHLLKSVDPSKVPTNQYIHTIYTHQSLSSWFYSSVKLVYINFRTLWYGRSHKSQNFKEICTLFIQQISRNFELCFKHTTSLWLHQILIPLGHPQKLSPLMGLSIYT